MDDIKPRPKQFLRQKSDLVRKSDKSRRRTTISGPGKMVKSSFKIRKLNQGGEPDLMDVMPVPPLSYQGMVVERQVKYELTFHSDSDNDEDNVDDKPESDTDDEDEDTQGCQVHIKRYKIN